MPDGLDYMEGIDRYVLDQRRRAGKGIVEIPRPTATKLRERRIKLVSVPIRVLVGLLTLSGDYAIKMEGWPEGARVIGARATDKPMAMVELVLYHPEFPPVLVGQEPGRITITAKRVG